jgi:hypothetical protein
MPIFNRCVLHNTWSGFYMAQKGQKIQRYTEDIKLRAVQMYEN